MKVPPAAFVQARLLDGDYTLAQTRIALAIAERINSQTGRCFVGRERLAKRARVSLRTFRRQGAVLWEGPAAIFARTYPGETDGHRHRCPRYTLIRNLEAFQEARAQARAANQERALEDLGELAQERLALQARHLRGELTAEDYERAIAALEAPALRRVGGPRNDPRRGDPQVPRNPPRGRGRRRGA